MLERDLLKVKLRSLAAREKLPPAQGSGPGPGAVLRGARVQISQRDRALHGGQLGENALDHAAAVEVLAPVAVTIDREQDLGELLVGYRAASQHDGFRELERRIDVGVIRIC